MTRDEKSQALRAEALSILQGGVLELLEREIGGVEVAGSVDLDLMAWPDIDLYARLEPSESGTLLRLVPKLAAQLARQGYALARVAVHDEYILPDPKFPATPGLYGGFTFISRQSGLPWKLDFWGWSGTWYDQRRAHHHTLHDSLRGADRDLILRLKEADGYGSVFLSVDVYAFALAGAGNSFRDFERFLRQHVAHPESPT